MTFHIATSTRNAAVATAGTAVVAAADLLDRQGTSTSIVLAAAFLLVGALLAARVRDVALTVGDDVVVVRGLLSERVIDARQVAGVTAGTWNSFIELRDGSSVMTLLRARDLEGLELGATTAPAPAAADRQLVTA